MYVIFVLYMLAALAWLRDVNTGERSELIGEDIQKGQSGRNL